MTSDFSTRDVHCTVRCVPCMHEELCDLPIVTEYSPVSCQAVLHAPSEGAGETEMALGVDESEMALSLANRSAALFHLQYYKVTYF